MCEGDEFNEFLKQVSTVLGAAENIRRSVDEQLVSRTVSRLEIVTNALRFFIYDFAASETNSENANRREFGIPLNELERYSTKLWQKLDTKLRHLRTMAFSVDVGPRTAAGRPKFQISKEQMEFLRIDIGFSWVDIARPLGVSVSTVTRRRHEFGLGIQRVSSNIDNQTLDEIIGSIGREHPSMGTVLVEGILLRASIRVSRERIRRSMMRIDYMHRKHTVINRRRYFAPGRNSRWHIDGNHKLFRWRLVVHAGIDGYSRLIVFMNCSTDNKAKTVATCFLSAVHRFG